MNCQSSRHFGWHSIIAPSLAIALLVIGPPAHATLKISERATKHVKCGAGVCVARAPDAVLNVTDLANMLAGGDVTVQSGNRAQDIDIGAALTWTSVHRLVFDSYRSIIFKQPVTVAGTGALTITTGGGGDFRFFNKGYVEFWDTHSSLVINGHNYALMDRLKSFRRALRNSDGTGHYYAQAKNWSFSGKTFSESLIDKDFNGTFEGLGNSISNLTIHGSEEGNIGFFQFLNFLAVVRDVKLKSVDMLGTGNNHLGALAGSSIASLVQNIDVSGQISAGGSGSFVGGILGVSGGPVRGCSSNAAITLASNAIGGGLVGWNLSEGKSPDMTGSYSTGTVSGAGAAIGGVIGQHDAGKISNTYADAAITGSGTTSAGGLIGVRTSSAASITNSYSTGTVSSGSGAPVGGSIGEDDAAGSGISNDYWDLDTSGVSNPHQGAGNVADDPGITGLTDAQLKSGLPAGFDPKVWAINPKINNGYPYLIDNPPPK